MQKNNRNKYVLGEKEGKGMKYKLTPSRVIFLVFAYAFLVLVGVACLAPLWHVLMGSISDPTELNANRGLFLWIKGEADFTAYGAVAGYKRLWMC